MTCNRVINHFRQGALIADLHAQQQNTTEAWGAAIGSWENLVTNSADTGRINREARDRLATANKERAKLRQRIPRLRTRWLEFCERLGLTGDTWTAGFVLFAHYEHPDRHYHNLIHIFDCLHIFDQANSEPRWPPRTIDRDAIEAAIWFHDAIYKIGSSDNEFRSAQLALKSLIALGLASDRSESIAALIQATDHKSDAVLGHDAAFLCDIDLSILGQPEGRYKAYVAAILRETGLSTNEFAPHRHAFLKSMLAKEHLFHTEYFRQYDAQARVNMQNELERWARVIASPDSGV